MADYKYTTTKPLEDFECNRVPLDKSLDYISRQAAIDAVKDMCKHYTPTKSVTHPHIDFVVDELQNLPSADVVEVVRCGDCTKYDTHDHRCKYWNHGVVVNDFCSKGEKNDNR